MRPLVALFLVSLTLSAAEVPIAEPGIVPGSSTFKRQSIDITAGDAGFLVAWEERAFGPYPGPLMVRAYDRDGRPFHEVPVQIDGAGHSAHAVWTGSEYLLVYARWLSRFGSVVPVPVILAVRIQPDGTPVEGSQVTLAEGQNTSYAYDLEWTGRYAMALVTVSGAHRFLRINAIGQKLGEDPLGYLPADSAGEEERFFVLSERDGDAAALHGDTAAIVENTGAGVIVSFMESRTRQLLGGFVLAPDGSGAGSIAWDGSAWVTAYVEEGAVCTARFTGEADAVRSCNGETSAIEPMIDARAGRSFTAWSRNRDQIVTESGLASTTVAVQQQPHATIDPAGLLAAWVENERIHIGGFTHDGAPRLVHVIDMPGPAFHPRVVNAGQRSLLVWYERGSLFAMRLDAAGVPLAPIVDLGHGNHASVATDGTNWLVAWRAPAEAVSTLITPNLDNNGLQHFGAPETAQSGPVVAATPSGYLVVWNELQPAPEGVHDRVVAEALDGNGQRVSGGVRLVDRVDNTRVQASTLTIGCNGARCLVVWDETAPGRADLIGVVVGPDAKPLGEPRVLRGNVIGDRKAILPFGVNGFRLYGSGTLLILDDDGAVLDAQTWPADGADLGAAVVFRDRPTLIYGRGPRVFVRDFGSRGRAVRH